MNGITLWILSYTQVCKKYSLDGEVKHEYVCRLNNPNIEYLSLRSNEIDDAKLEILCEGLKNNTSLRFLELCDNLITKAGQWGESNLDWVIVDRNKSYQTFIADE